MTTIYQEPHEGIWKYYQYLGMVNPQSRLSLGEGDTPEIEIDNILFKREDMNPTGSIKDRGFAYQISKLYEQGIGNLVISSSGNAAISAASYCQLKQMNLYAFVSPKINSCKLEILKKKAKEIIISKRPLSDSLKFSKDKNYVNLRPSIWPEALEGYQTIAFELNENQGKIDHLFIPVSSATALVGINNGFKRLGYSPKIHAVQTTYTNPISCLFDQAFQVSSSSLADALVAKITPRGKEAAEIIRYTGGSGWIIGDEEITNAWMWLREKDIITSAEGACALAGIWKAVSKNYRLAGKIVCLLTGKKYETNA